MGVGETARPTDEPYETITTQITAIESSSQNMMHIRAISS
jgi:hypothetical protein